MDARPEPVLSRWSDRKAVKAAALPEIAGISGVVPGLADSPAAALRRAGELHPGRDVLLLSADAELPEAAWLRLEAAWHHGDWDVLSPIDGRPRLFPDTMDGPARDAFAWTLGEHAAFTASAWSPTCSLWRGACIEGRADGDDSTLRKGLLPCLYVGPARTPDGEELPLPLARLQARIESRGPGSPAQNRQPALLHVLHDWGGGVEYFARDLARGDTERQHLFLVARGNEHRAPFGRRLCLHLELGEPPIRTWTLANAITHTSVRSPEVESILAMIIGEWGVGSVLVSSLIGHSLDALRTGLPTACCVHDTYPAWPLLHDSRDPAGEPFDEAALAEGLAKAGPGFVLAGSDAATWWSLRQHFLAALETAKASMVAPSDYAHRRYLALAPATAQLAWQVIPHGMAPRPPSSHAAHRRAAGAPLRVLVPGRLQGAKGEHLIAGVLESLPAGVELVLLGSGHAGARFESKPRVEVHRDYRREDIADWVARLAPDLALLPSTAPETFGYTLAEMLQLRVPVLCTAGGSPSEQLATSGAGWVVAPDAAAINATLARLAGDRGEIDRARACPAPPTTSLEKMAQRWRDVLPVAAGALAFAPATAAALARLGLEDEVARLRKRVARREQELADAWLELDRRAQWAHDLQRELVVARQTPAELDEETARLPEKLAQAQTALAHSSERISENELEIARLEEYITELDQQLAEAHGYYQRDSTDLGRQRDVALAQRDEALAGLSDIRQSFSWRMTALPRRLTIAIRNRLSASTYRIRHFRTLVDRGIASLRMRGIADTWKRMKERRTVLSESRLPVSAPIPVVSENAMRLPRPPAPQASIIIPAYNQLHYTLACLRSLSDCGDRSPFEVIVVDDASSDASSKVLASIPGLRYHRNPRNLGFIGACNAGAELATGKFLVFLNNDTAVQPGWLDALLDTFGLHPDTGLAGSKLVYPDGRLQEAGGIIFADGSGWNYGRFEDPAHPRFGFVREVDYCSGASIAIARDVFLRLGGFDSHYAPAYYEDTDLAMRVRAHGLKVRYQPASVAIHHEGISSGSDLSQGVKAFQVVNHRKFVERWRDVLASAHLPPGSSPEVASARGRRRRVLVLDACTPMPDRDSGSVRMLALLRVLQEENCSVEFFAENRAHDGRYTEALQQLGVQAWWHPYLADIPKWMAANAGRFDLIIASRHYVLSPLLALVRTHFPRAHLVFDTVDLHYLREQREAELSGDAAQERQAARTRRVEIDLIARVDTTWVVSAAEKALLAESAPKARVEIVSNIHDVKGPGLPWDQRSDLLFVGSYRHPPNVDAALWMARTILPLVRERLPEVQLHLVGGDAPDEVSALGELPGVRFHGYLPDLLPLLERSRVGVAPLRYGAGVKGKVNQSLAHGQPVVATLCAVEGMHLVDGEDVLVADEAQAFADAVVRLYGDAVLWQRLSAGGMANTRRHFSPDAVRETVRALIATLPVR